MTPPIAQKMGPDGELRIESLDTDGLFRVARGTRVAIAEALRDLNGYFERHERVLSQILLRIERAGTGATQRMKAQS